MTPFISLCFLSVDEGLSIKIDFETFETEDEVDVVNLFEGTGAEKTLACEFMHNNAENMNMLMCSTSASSFT